MSSKIKHKLGLALVILYITEGYFLNLFTLIFGFFQGGASERLLFSASAKYLLTSTAYVCVAILIWLETESLGEFHIERISLLILVFFGPLLRTTPRIPAQSIYLTIIFVSCLVILVIMIRNWSKIPKTNLQWFTKGAFLVFLLLIIITALESLQPEAYSRADPLTYNPFLDMVRRTFYNLSSTSSIEEVMFRGFFLGYLIKLGWDEKKAFWAQAIIFWLGHFLKILGTPITFLIALPINIFAFSMLVRKTKQVFWAIVFHTIGNVLVPVFLTSYFL